MLYEHSGYHVNSPASFVVPCGRVPFGTGRNGPAEWIRTAYHDMANADVVAGTGGIDASIGFELDRDENPGKGFNETLFNLRDFMTARTSMSDLIAMGALFAAGGCSGGKVLLPFRGGRIDAAGAGPKGVPRPEETLESHEAAFARQGFNQEEMIGLVACGHTLGGVHGVDFPQIVAVVNDTTTDDNTQTFDPTNDGESAFDNEVASDFVSNIGNNPLAFGHNVTTNSDGRIFNSDGGKLIRAMAQSNDFFLSKCQTLLEKMINTVPKGVTLGEPIEIIPVKPSSLYATVGDSLGKMTVSGLVRLVSRENSWDADPGRQVKIHIRPRSGTPCSSTTPCTVVEATEFSWSRSLYHEGGFPYFKKYQFTQEIPTAQGIAAFDVEVLDTASNGSVSSTLHTNGGKGFPFDDTILTQPKMTCNGQKSSGIFNLTIAVRNDAGFREVKANFQLPQPLDALVPKISTESTDLKKIDQPNHTGYTLFHTQYRLPVGTYTLTYDLVASNATKTVRRLFNEVSEIKSCPGSD
ncbi:hypothetical protein NLG97_g651 [Lecanicillium saksenae]|uniref:Uncharacterized protein n=1 Tax=Lecanicillium saksenae TaxID=468837 RepID=A0ACC1R5W8_9HYPO|nr:hypothetical protein NLG97_g651 [Lecanicillium saksenae]